MQRNEKFENLPTSLQWPIHNRLEEHLLYQGWNLLLVKNLFTENSYQFPGEIATESPATAFKGHKPDSDDHGLGATNDP